LEFIGLPAMSSAGSGGPFSHMAAGPRTIVFPLGGPLARADLPALCERGRTLLEASGADVLVCDARGLVDADAVALDAIARLQLTARRLGGRICVRHAPAELEDLLRLTGLAEICGLLSVLERKAEEREDSLGVEEEGQLDDPPA
jgi:anti-anti-sigma regulatory factor